MGSTAPGVLANSMEPKHQQQPLRVTTILTTQLPPPQKQAISDASVTTIAASSTRTATTSTPQKLSVKLEAEVAQANAFRGALLVEASNGGLFQRIEAEPALAQVTKVTFVDQSFAVAVGTDTVTALEGQCELSGITVSDFLEPQRLAFRAVIASSSNAALQQVTITSVASVGGDRRLRGRVLADSGGVQVTFLVAVPATNGNSGSSSSDETLTAGAVAGIVVAVVLGVLAIAAVAVLLVLYFLRRKSTDQIKRSPSDLQSHMAGKKPPGMGAAYNDAERASASPKGMEMKDVTAGRKWRDSDVVVGSLVRKFSDLSVISGDGNE